MDSNRLEELLQQYWDCETSLEEEQLLREYFQSANIPGQLKDTASLFQYFESQKKKSLNDASFDESIITKSGLKKSKSASLLYNSMRIAAGIAVLMASIWFVRLEVRKTTSQEMLDTYNDPKLAFEETKKALLMISKSFGKAEEQAKKINIFNEAQEEIQKKNQEVKM